MKRARITNIVSRVIASNKGWRRGKVTEREKFVPLLNTEQVQPWCI